MYICRYTHIYIYAYIYIYMHIDVGSPLESSWIHFLQACCGWHKRLAGCDLSGAQTPAVSQWGSVCTVGVPNRLYPFW